MRPTFYADALDWFGYGYSARPTPRDDAEFSKNPESRLWITAEQILERAKRGIFTDVPHLLEVYDRGGALLRFVSSRLLGDIGTNAVFQQLSVRVSAESGAERINDYCNALTAWGSLQTIPVLLEGFDKSVDTEFVDAYPLNFSSLLEAEWGPIALEFEPKKIASYRELILERSRALAAKLGDEALVYCGDRYGVQRIARLLLERVTRPGDFESSTIPDLRRKFEASTGIDCSAFFEDGGLRPLAAVAVVEHFLDSPEAEKYQEGVRYFFGHRIPD